MNKHVTNPELSIRLKDLGVKQDSQFYWVWLSDEPGAKHREGWILEDQKSEAGVSAFLASELGDLLPAFLLPSSFGEPSGYPIVYLIIDKEEYNNNKQTYWNICYHSIHGVGPMRLIEKETLPDALGEMLAYLLEKGLIKLEGE